MTDRQDCCCCASAGQRAFRRSFNCHSATKQSCWKSPGANCLFWPPLNSAFLSNCSVSRKFTNRDDIAQSLLKTQLKKCRFKFKDAKLVVISSTRCCGCWSWGRCIIRDADGWDEWCGQSAENDASADSTARVAKRRPHRVRVSKSHRPLQTR